MIIFRCSVRNVTAVRHLVSANYKRVRNTNPLSNYGEGKLKELDYNS